MGTLMNYAATAGRSQDDRFWKELYDKVPKGTFVDDLPKGIEVGSDLLVSADVWSALQDRYGAQTIGPLIGPLNRVTGVTIAMSSWLPSGSIAGGNERGRRMVREMKEAEARMSQNGKEWLWRTLFAAWESMP